MANIELKDYLTGLTEDTTPDTANDMLLEYDASANALKKVKMNLVGGAGSVSQWKQPVRVATTANGTLATAYENGDTVDGVVLATGDRIFLKDQTTGAENGIYTVNASGAPTRATDADAGSELVSAVVMVTAGTANADKAFKCTNDSITLGSTSLTFTEFGGGLSGGATDVLTKWTGASSVGQATGLSQASGVQLISTAQAASDVPLRVKQAASQSGNSFEVDSSAGSSGNIFKITSAGNVSIPDAQAYQIGGLTVATATSGDTQLGITGFTGTRIHALTYVRDFIGGNAVTGTISTGFNLTSTGTYGFVSAGDPTITPDTGIKRLQAKILGVTDGTNTLGVVPGETFVSNQGGDTTLTNGTGAQSIFNAANDTLTVLANTTYFFEALYVLTNGTTTHTTATLFGGTATFTSISYWAELWSNTDGTILATAPSVLRVAVATSTVLNATSTAAGTVIRLRGIIRTNAAGTIIPQIAFSAAPGGTNLGKNNSFFRLYPVGSDTVAAVGAWA